MKFLFDDESFSFETLRAAGYANAGGADLGEILVTARAIPEGGRGGLAPRMESDGAAGRGARAAVAGGRPFGQRT
ncbi:hypothetical protein [Mycolicibacterium mageritense]|uniref:hypothetical protein n=1 Tax=Mycolicibacterium mageritense TaxID=53462 RepID=UPI001E5C1215|nr:hypothetical protein [Mycolicibacterium mageritense]GJJ17216.1 hypothetical protein MTY414_08890 [Mycolicibacterium mageritense]